MAGNEPTVNYKDDETAKFSHCTGGVCFTRISLENFILLNIQNPEAVLRATEFVEWFIIRGLQENPWFGAPDIEKRGHAKIGQAPMYRYQEYLTKGSEVEVKSKIISKDWKAYTDWKEADKSRYIAVEYDTGNVLSNGTDSITYS